MISASLRNTMKDVENSNNELIVGGGTSSDGEEIKKLKSKLKWITVGAFAIILLLTAAVAATANIALRLTEELTTRNSETALIHKTAMSQKKRGGKGKKGAKEINLPKGVLVTLDTCYDDEDFRQLLKGKIVPKEDVAIQEVGSMSCDDAKSIANCIQNSCDVSILDTSLSSKRNATSSQVSRLGLGYAKESIRQVSTGAYIDFISGIELRNRSDRTEKYVIICKLPPNYEPASLFETVVAQENESTSTTCPSQTNGPTLTLSDDSLSCQEVPMCLVYKKFKLESEAEIFVTDSSITQSTTTALIQLQELYEADAIDNLSSEALTANLQPLVDSFLNEMLKDEEQDVFSTTTDPMDVVEMFRNMYQGDNWSYIKTINEDEMNRRRLQNRHLSTAVSLHEANMNRKLWFGVNGEESCSGYRFYMVSSGVGTALMCLMLLAGLPLAGATATAIRKTADALTDVIPNCLLDTWFREIDFGKVDSLDDIPDPDASDDSKSQYILDNLPLVDFVEFFVVNFIVFGKIVDTVGLGYVLKHIYKNLEWYHYVIMLSSIAAKLVAYALSGGGAAYADAGILIALIANAVPILDNILQFIAAVVAYISNGCISELPQSEINDCSFSPCGMDGVQEVNQSCGKGIAPKWCKPDYCCDLDTNTCTDEDTFVPSNLVCNRGGSKGWGQSCGVQPTPKWCKNDYCCDTDMNICVKLVENSEVWEYEYPKSKYECDKGGSKSNGQSCGKQPAPKYCKNSYCCDTSKKECVSTSSVSTHSVIPEIERRKLKVAPTAEELFPM